jgi:hypothetical protein
VTQNLSVFAPTADQRFLLGSDLFLRTHFPMAMRRYTRNGGAVVVTEDTLLNEILDQNHSGPGNRLWILYGAPGSGKSELVKWLETRLAQEDTLRRQLTIRVSRNELDVLSIVNRFLDLLPDYFLAEATHQRWQAARQKSRTLSKLILLFALENLLESDELINALFYRLLNAVQPYVDIVLAMGFDTVNGRPTVELLGQETWEAIVRETSLPVPIEYEQLRHQLTVAFRDHLLEGLSLPDTMQRISVHCLQTHGRRPILLVDDLVQSLNIFATDLLDYLLTLEAGNWDVVIGLTPAAFEDSLRGRTLLQRIAHMDTVDDRAEKLWLSDATGQESYILTEDNCHEFASRYLAELDMKAISFPTPLAEDSPLFPFNQEVLIRIYRGLPAGKGKLRYFVRALHDILMKVAAGEDILDVLVDYAQPEYVARSDNDRLARLYEFYGPLLNDGKITEIVVPASLLAAFAVEAAQPVVPIEPLVRFYWRQEAAVQMVDDESRTAVRDWLLEKPVNRQLLKKLRQGAARWLRSLEPLDWLRRDYTAKPQGVLRWRKTYLGTQPPICVEGVDDDQDGILLSREIGMLAFDLCRYATATGIEAKALQAQLAAATTLIPFHFRAQDYRRRLWQQLEQQLGMRLELLALSLYVFALAVNGEAMFRIPACPPAFWSWLTELNRRYRWQQGYFDEKIWKSIESLFADFFELRRAFYDGVRIQRLLEENDYHSLLERLCQINALQINKDYLLGGQPIQSVLQAVQTSIKKCERPEKVALSRPAQQLLDALERRALPLVEVPAETLEEIRTLQPEVYAALRVHLMLPDREED